MADVVTYRLAHLDRQVEVCGRHADTAAYRSTVDVMGMLGPVVRELHRGRCEVCRRVASLRTARTRRLLAQLSAGGARAVASALYGLVGCPPGGWPETEQALRTLRDELPRYVRADAVIDACLCEAGGSADAVGRYALREGGPLAVAP